jgi:superfamily II DNA or RNA helicase
MAVRRAGAHAILTLEGRGDANRARRLIVLTPFDRPRHVSAARLRRRPRRAVMRAALHAAHTVRRIDGLWTAAGSSIELWPYQLEPALAVIRGAGRVLLADAVGLGKTIQAALILAELRERGWAEHALIVCPAGLRETWSRELRERFGIAATIVDQPAIAERIASLPPGINPWTGIAVAIASIDFIKRPEVMAAVKRRPIDLLIADEAHHLAPATDRGAAVSRLASRSPWVVMISATPHCGDAAAFDYLCDVGSTGDRIAMFHRTRRDIGLHESRRTHVLAVHPDDRECAFLAEVDRYTRLVWKARGQHDAAARLVAITLARRAASSPAAAERTLVRRLALLSGEPQEPPQPQLPWDDADGEDDVEGDAILGTAGLPDAVAEQAAITHLILLARQVTASSKLNRLRRLIDRVAEPVVVFTEYRDTLAALEARLSDRRRVGVIHGGLAAAARQSAIDAFNHGRLDVLVATDAAGEGLNLHRRCRLVVDVELPWNPRRLEQRVGRVDRLGQSRTVHAIRMFHPGTIEQHVLEHLQLRAHRAGVAMESRASETDVARAVFEGGAMPLAVGASLSSDRIAGGVSEALRATEARSIKRIAAADATRCWSVARRPGALMLLHRVTFRNTAGSTTGDVVVAHRVDLSSRPSNRREWRHVIESLDAAVGSSVVASVGAWPTLDGLDRRIGVIRARLAGHRLVQQQRSLFDGRADAEALERERTVATLDASLLRILVAATAPIDRNATRTELVAAWTASGE